MADNINPLEYHYKVGIKFDYFILSADIALLGWTVVNTEWLPKGEIFVWLIGGFWILIILSIVFGIFRQLYNGMVFGLNYQVLQAGELASTIERSASQSSGFVDQQTGKITSSDDFKKFAVPHRDKEKRGEKFYEKFNSRSALFANLAMWLLVAALLFFAGIKIYSLTM